MIMLPNKNAENIEEGGRCPTETGCTGVLIYTSDGDCSCHVNPPCSACENSYLTCPECGWEDEY